MMEYNSNKQGRPDDQKAGDRTIYPIQVSRFLQNARCSYFTGKNQEFLIARGQTISRKLVVWAPLQLMY
jgi:hypothetical protein